MSTSPQGAHNERMQRIIADLKEEIFVELDRRIKETEDHLSQQVSEEVITGVSDQISDISDKVSTEVGEQVTETVEGYIGEEVTRQIRARERLAASMSKNFYSFQQNLQLYYKIPYAVMVISGFLLFWYGGWAIIREIPVLNNGVVALLVGALLLFITGSIYKKLID